MTFMAKMTRPICIAFFIVLFSGGLFACSSGPDTQPDEAEQRAARQKRQAKPPSADEVGDGPCGNPDWAKLPDGAQEKSGRVGEREE